MTKTPLWPDHVGIERCRTLLREKLASLGKNNIDRTCLEGVRAPDEMDTIVGHQILGLYALQLTGEAKLKRSILAALQRIDNSDYGSCVDCEEPIAFNRLMALPWAERCKECQEKYDINAKEECLEPDLPLLD